MSTITASPLMNQVNQVAAYNSVEAMQKALASQAEVFRQADVVFDGRVRVARVENGFLVDISAAPGARVKSYVAANVEEVNSLVMAAMVDFRLSEGR